LKDLREAANEARARLTKAKERQESAQARGNELQAQLVLVTAEKEALAARVAAQDDVKRAVWDMAQAAKAGIDQGVADVLASL
jgi:chromosome segregation ATPase